MGQNPSIASYLDYAEYGLQGRRPEMEDASTIKVPFGQPYQAFFGVFDGHFGIKCSHFIAKRLPEILLQYLKTTDPESALKQAFKDTDKEFLKQAKTQNLTDGSTGIVALIIETTLFVANTGDSRAVLCEDGKAIPLSKDHKPEVPEELARFVHGWFSF
jgi:serine/threonine protein phosphatase PrpC